MTFDTTEKSVQDGRPRELYTFESSSGTWNLTTSKEDETYGGQLYTATPGLSRSNVSESPLGEKRALTVMLPVTHAIALDLLGNGIPPRTATVTIRRFHDGSDTAYRVWKGGIAEIETDDESARLRVPSLLELAFDVKLPILKAARLCPHALYGPGCQAVRPGFNTTIIAVSADGYQITLLTDEGRPDGDLNGGEVVRVDDNEARTILEHVGDVLTIDVPFRTLAIGNTVNSAPGCDGQPTTCRDKFDNMDNFGSHPDLPEVNPTTAQPPKGRAIWDVLKGGG